MVEELPLAMLPRRGALLAECVAFAGVVAGPEEALEEVIVFDFGPIEFQKAHADGL